MASGKRASMREGPLAALFRRTDEAADEADAAARAAEQTARPSRGSRSGPLSETPRAGSKARISTAAPTPSSSQTAFSSAWMP